VVLPPLPDPGVPGRALPRLTRPPSEEGKSKLPLKESGIPADKGPAKYSELAMLPPPKLDRGVEGTGEGGIVGESDPLEAARGRVHCRASVGLKVLTFSPMQLRKDPVAPVVPGCGAALEVSYTSKAILCNWETGSPHTSPGAQ